MSAVKNHLSDVSFKNNGKLKLLLCVEEPENQLYPELLEELAEEFRMYANEGGQVFVSTHSPDFLNAIFLDEIFYFEKKTGLLRFIKHQRIHWQKRSMRLEICRVHCGNRDY